MSYGRPDYSATGSHYSRKERYFLATGQEGKRVTVRVIPAGAGDYHGNGWHVATLGRHLDHIVKKIAEMEEEYGIEIEGDPYSFVEGLSEDREGRSIDHSLLPSGKYEGESFYDVADWDLPYLVWWYRSHDNARSSYRKTLDLMDEFPPIITLREEGLERGREKERQKEIRERRWEEERLASEWMGEVGERGVFDLKIVNVYEGISQFGDFAIVTMKDKDGNTFVYKGSAWFPSSGAVVKIKATIKAHDEYEGQKQTILSRIKKMNARRRSK
jgi:hypothetical protein